MTCPEEFELFQLREGGLDETQMGQVAGHVATCPDCQVKLAEIEAVGKALAEAEPLSAEDKAAFVAGVVERLETQQPKGFFASKGRLLGIVVPVAAAVACAGLALVVVPTLSSQAPQMASSPAWQEEEEMLAMADRSQAAPSGTAHEPLPAPPPAAATPTLTNHETQARAQAHGLSEQDQSGSWTGNRTKSARPAPLQQALHGRPGGRMDLAEGRSGGQGAGPAGNLRARRKSAAQPPPAPAATAGEGALGGLQGAPRDWRQSADGELAREPRRYNTIGAVPGQASPTGGAGPAYGHGVGRDGRSTTTGPVANQPSSIDPNGRFATTYRPGRGHLAEFEASLFRGRVPEPALALVAEVGQGSGPTLTPPTEQALALQMTPGMASLPPEGGPVHLAISLRSTAQHPQGRPPMAVHLVMDTSGSMSGAAIEHAREAARQLVGLLQPGDRFSLVSYSSSARVVVQQGPVGPRRAQILGQISGLRPGGGTNLSSGLRQGYEQAEQAQRAGDAVHLVIVLSDGRANQGITEPWALSEMAAAAFQKGFETTALGVGDNYDPMVMSTLAEYGAGGYYYVPDSSAIQRILGAELQVRSQPVARAVELRVRLAEGVELLQAYGSRRLNEMESSRVRSAEVAIDEQAARRDGIEQDRQEDRQGGMRFFIPGFARDDQHTVLLRLRVPAGSAGASRTLASVELQYKDRILRANQGDERQLSLPYASSRQQAVASQSREIRRAVLMFRTGQALSEVATHVSHDRQPQALATLYERTQLLRAASDQLGDPSLRAEAERLNAFRQLLASRGSTNRLLLGAIAGRAGTSLMR